MENINMDNAKTHNIQDITKHTIHPIIDSLVKENSRFSRAYLAHRLKRVLPEVTSLYHSSNNDYVSLPEYFCDLLLMHYTNATKVKKFSLKKIDFKMLELDPNEPIFKTLSDYLQSYQISYARIHYFDKYSELKEHTDTAYPGFKTLVIRLDNKISMRLKINRRYVNESKGQRHVIPEGVLHEVTKGSESRYSLVAWCKNKTE